MQERKQNPRDKSDQDLVQALARLRVKERQLRVEILRHIQEVRRRGLHAKAGYSSLFTYLTQKLGYSKSTAYRLNCCGKICGSYPRVYSMLASGEFSPTTLAKLVGHLKDPDFEELLDQAAARSADEIDLLLAKRRDPRDLFEHQDQSRIIGVLNSFGEDTTQATPSPEDTTGDHPTNATAGETPEEQSNPSPKPREVIVRISFTTTKEVKDKIDHVKNLLGRKHPKGKMSDVLDEVLESYIERHDPARRAARSKEREARAAKKQSVNEVPAEPRREDSSKKAGDCTTSSRYVPARVRHHLNGGEMSCSYVSPEGRRCGETRYLEYDHSRPYALGGSSECHNVRLLCRGHNSYLARCTFGSG